MKIGLDVVLRLSTIAAADLADQLDREVAEDRLVEGRTRGWRAGAASSSVAESWTSASPSAGLR